VEDSSPFARASHRIQSLSLKTKIIAGFALPVLVMSSVSGLIYQSTQELVTTADWVKHTQEVISKGHRLENLILDLESREQGFLITGKESFLEPFEELQRLWNLEIALTSELVGDNPPQVARLQTIDQQAKTWVKEVATAEIAQRRQVQTRSISLDHIESLLKKKTGKSILDRMRGQLDLMHTALNQSHSHHALNLLVAISKTIVDQETGERGFLITGKEEYLEPYVSGKKDFRQHISQLKSLLLNAPNKARTNQLIDELKNLAEQWHQQAATPEIKVRRDSQGEDEAVVFKKIEQLLSQGTGKNILDALRQRLDTLQEIYDKAKNEQAQTQVLAIAKSLVDQETGQRGFLITGQERFLEPFHQGQVDFQRHLDDLKETSDNSYDKQQLLNQIEALENNMSLWQEQAAKEEISVRRELNRSGLSLLESLHNRLERSFSSPQLLEAKRLLQQLNKSRPEDQNQLTLQRIIDKQQLLLSQQLLGLGDDNLAQFQQQRERADEVMVELLVQARSLKGKAARERSEQLKQLRRQLFQWQQLSLALTDNNNNNNNNNNISRAQALKNIQIQLNGGTGKQLLDEARLIIDDINQDFIEAKNIRGSTLMLQIGKSLVDQETGERGFIITGEDEFLEPYREGGTHLKRTLAEVSNTASQTFPVDSTLAAIDTIDALIQQWLSLAARPEIALREQVNQNQAQHLSIVTSLDEGQGKYLLDKIRHQQQQLNNRFERAENQTALRLIVALAKSIVDMESGQRGFLITGKAEFLQPFEQGLSDSKKYLEELREVTRGGYDAREMAAKIDRLREKTEQWQEQAGKPEIALRRTLNRAGSSMEDVIRMLEEGAGRHYIDNIRTQLKAFIEVEESLIRERAATSQAAVDTTLSQTLFGTLLTGLLTLLVASILLHTILKSLRNLIQATNQVTAGDYTAEITVDSKDQIGQLASDFNSMTRQLYESHSAMQESNIALEQQRNQLQLTSEQIEEKNKDLVNAQTALKNYADDLEQANTYKSDFLATMSHEIRTPMNGVLGMLGLLLKSQLTEKQKKQASMAKHSAQSLLTIINDILDFSKIDAGKLELELLDFNLNDLLGNQADSIALKAQEKNLEVILDAVGIENPMVKGDPSRLQQILTNLLGNAIKFTERGEITLRASLIRQPGGNIQLNCEIQDTGIGIEPSAQEYLFQAFRQVDASTTRKYGGTGLGLSIVKKLCQLMGGDIKYHNPEAGGSCFAFHITLQPSERSDHPLPELNFDALKLLVVDAHPGHLQSICQQLRQWGAEADGHTSAATALQRLTEQTAARPQLVFIDSELAGMGGEQLARDIRALAHGDQIRLIMMTRVDHQGDEAYFNDLGIDAHFMKPATPSDLFDSLMLTSHCFQQSNGDGSSKQALTDSTGDAETPAALLWPAHTRLLVAEDNIINQEVVKNLLEDLGLSADLVANGEEVLEMLRRNIDDNPYSLILMDCQMPVMDGYSATRAIRQGKAGSGYKQLPIVALTANAMSGDREACLDAGMNDYLSKPLEPDELANVLNRWLRA